MRKKAFGLVETSILLVIIGFVTVSAISIFELNNRDRQLKINKLKTKYQINKISHLNTEERLDKIYDAIKIFIIQNHRLPCPDNDNDGIEADNPGICTSTSNGTGSGYISGENISYGNLPYITLGLSSDFLQDEWANNFIYHIDRRFSKKTANLSENDGFSGTKTMYEMTSNNIINDASFELIKITDGANIIEPDDNLTNNVRPESSYIFVIVSGGQNGINSENSDNSNNIFTLADQDILLFKNKQEILQDAKLENFRCTINDGKILFNGTGDLGSCNNVTTANFENIIYYEDVYAMADCPCDGSQKITRKCQKYGIWKNISSMFSNQCN